MTVKVVKPIKITEAVLTASSIPEPDASVGEVEWVEDRFSGYAFNNNVTTKNAFDAIEMDGFIYVVEGKENAIGEGLAYLHKYQIGGTHVWSESIDNSVDAFIAKGHLPNTVVLIESGDVNVITFNVNTMSQTTQAISPLPEFPSGIAFDGFKYYVLDSYTGLVRRYNTDFTYDDLEIDPKLGKFSLFSLKYHNGNLSIVDQKTGKIVTFTINSETVSSFDFSGAFQQNENCTGHFYLDGSVYTVDNSNSNAYKFTSGIYDGYYQPAERAILTSTHKLYQCVKATNIRPDLGATGDETESWVEVGATNKFASFDDRLFYPAKITGTQTFELTIPDRLNTVAFLNLSGITSVRVQMDVGGSIVYDETKDALDFSLIYDHYTWWFSDSELLTELIFDDLPPYPNSKLIIDVTGEGDLGQIVTGFGKEIGVCLAESSSNTIDLSTQEFDAFGNRKYVPRPIIKLNKYEILSDKSAGPAIERLFKEIAGGNALWIGEIGGDQLLTTYGYTERSPIPYNMPNDINYSATIRGSA